MSTATSWKSELSFSDRMSHALQLSTAIQATSPEKDTSTARVKARKIENAILESASSQENYKDSIKETLAGYQRLTDEHPSPRNNGHIPQDQQDAIPQPPKPSQQIGPYPNCTHHASGLFSTVYRTKSLTNPSQLLAIKLTTPHTESPPHNSRREARILQSLTHPHIIPLLSTHTIQTPQTTLLLTFPFLPLDLSTRLNTRTPLPLSLLQDLFSALAHLHKNNILHRDIKPSNILLASPSGPAYLADFGIAWHPTDPDSEPADQKISDVGTTCYRAPELLFGSHSYGTGIDLWAAGCVVAEVLMHATSHYENGWTLFDAGELGSELALIKSQFETLGTPDEGSWPEARGLPDWGKMGFVKFAGRRWEEVLPGVGERGRGVVGGLVRFESGERMGSGEMVEVLGGRGCLMDGV